MCSITITASAYQKKDEKYQCSTHYKMTTSLKRNMENMTVSPLPVTISENTTDYMYYYDDPVMDGVYHFSMVIYAVAFVLGTIGNGLVIWIAGFKMRKTVNVVWFLNLAVADFIFTFFLPLSIAYLALGFHWPFGNFMCKFNSALAFLNMFASIFTLTVISIDRFVSVVFAVWAQNHRTLCLASIVSVVIWGFALCFSLTYFIFRDTKEEKDGTIFCYNNFHETDTDLLLMRLTATVITRSICGFFIPFTVIVASYVVIALRVHRNHMTTSTKPFKVIVAVMVTFFVCWLPYHIIGFVELYSFDKNDYSLQRIIKILSPFVSSMAFLNSCINPFLYVFIGRDFKTKFRTSIQSIFERAFMEDNQQADLRSKTKSTSDSMVV
uniref:G-protein coupled receptors family 1 profile domain-containing protein n=1 Tax=Leptobrachium leishanense TaxID=445787 RepID=A0A8C5WFK4_9ANUR